jgi:hypothetical protein
MYTFSIVVEHTMVVHTTDEKLARELTTRVVPHVWQSRVAGVAQLYHAWYQTNGTSVRTSGTYILLVMSQLSDCNRAHMCTLALRTSMF